ncbi:hypothetical protein RchiOBHm_Chr1g0366821 [Rosa chinensis]|uniref:Uncharacterized protein n=1 Tax=Rosa chinensis TaxID=74649 RepID=A0A2P6SKD7_ROSCH|nr:hypothetical protein RchiOBHm_Chr1g0366821 [Rosa chinensis]
MVMWVLGTIRLAGPEGGCSILLVWIEQGVPLAAAVLAGSWSKGGVLGLNLGFRVAGLGDGPDLFWAQSSSFFFFNVALFRFLSYHLFMLHCALWDCE